MSGTRVVVVGAGATGLSAACALARMGIAIDLLSLGAPRRGVVASSADAIAAAMEEEGELAAHVEDATFAGAEPAQLASIRALVAAAPGLLSRLDTLGIPFARGDAGPLRLRASGHRRNRLATAGPTTKREIVEALDRELAVVARTHPGRVRRLEGWEVVAIATHDGACIGVVAQDLRSMEIHGVPAHAVLLASGGFAGAWGASAAAPAAVGGATAAALRAGAALADADVVDLAPLAIAGRAKRHAISDILRASGARVWVPLDPKELRRARDVPAKEKRDLLRELDNAAAHLVAPGPSARAIARVLYVEGAGVFDVKRQELEACAYVDLGHLGDAFLPEARAEIGRLARVTGVDLAAAPARVVPAVQDTLGGLAVRFEIDRGGDVVEDSGANHATTIRGLYAAGSAASAYHGHTRLPGHRLLEGIDGGTRAARAVAAHCEETRPPAAARSALEAAEADARASYAAILKRDGEHLSRALRASLGEALDALSGLSVDPAPVDELSARIEEIAVRAGGDCSADDDATYANRGAPEVRRLEATAQLARAVVATARARQAAGEEGEGRILVRFGDGSFVTESAARVPGRASEGEVAP